MRTLFRILLDNIRYKDQILYLAKIDQKKQYKGSDLGFIWAYVTPSLYVAVFYIAISIGFRSSKNISGIDCPYFVWLTVGLVAWFYMRDMLVGGAGVFKKYRGLVLKTNFPIGVLPTIRATSCMMVHMVLMLAAFVLAFCFGVRPTIYWLQLPLYTILMYITSILWSIGTGLLSVVNRDFFNFLKSISTAIFWLSAVMFDVNGTGDRAQTFFLFNPITYIAEGYRNCICRQVWIWEEPKKFFCYLCVMGVFALFAIIMYKIMRKILPDLV